jgi:hypothetical protein
VDQGRELPDKSIIGAITAAAPSVSMPRENSDPQAKTAHERAERARFAAQTKRKETEKNEQSRLCIFKRKAQPPAGPNCVFRSHRSAAAGEGKDSEPRVNVSEARAPKPIPELVETNILHEKGENECKQEQLEEEIQEEQSIAVEPQPEEEQMIANEPESEPQQQSKSIEKEIQETHSIASKTVFQEVQSIPSKQESWEAQPIEALQEPQEEQFIATGKESEKVQTQAISTPQPEIAKRKDTEEPMVAEREQQEEQSIVTEKASKDEEQVISTSKPKIATAQQSCVTARVAAMPSPQRSRLRQPTKSRDAIATTAAAAQERRLAQPRLTASAAGPPSGASGSKIPRPSLHR